MTRRTSPFAEPLADQDERWEERACALPQSVGALRAGLVAFAARHGADATTCDDVALASSEALTNAVIHAFVGRPPGTVTAIGEIIGDALIVHIIDDGRGMTPRNDSPGAGFGIKLMTHLTSSLDIREAPGGRGTETCLTFQRAVRAQRPPNQHPGLLRAT